MNKSALTSLQAPLPATATHQVFDALYEAIITLKLRPGEKISEAEVAKQLDMSRQPVRDAFFRLSKLGFINIRPQRVSRITKISESAVLQASFIRTALEVSCLHDFIERAETADHTELAKILDLQEKAVAEDRLSFFHELDELFHKRIYDIAGHGYVLALIKEQKAHIDRVRYLSLRTGINRAYSEHRKILKALQNQDIDHSETLLRLHLGHIDEIMAMVRLEHASYFEELPV